jgi:hypothetical protein
MISNARRGGRGGLGLRCRHATTARVVLEEVEEEEEEAGVAGEEKGDEEGEQA